MTTLGVIGGIAPASTIEYYRMLVAAWESRTHDGSLPPVIIDSIDMQTMLRLLASNTPHIMFAELQRRSSIPLLSIVDCAYDAAHAMGLRRVGLLGTKFTMQATFYPEAFTRRGITLVVPDEADQDYVHARYMGELVKGVYLPETRAGLVAVIERLRERSGIDGVILGGTELPLILRAVGDVDVPLLDTARIHVEAAVDRMVSSRS
jgi:aspartate racemase